MKLLTRLIPMLAVAMLLPACRSSKDVGSNVPEGQPAASLTLPQRLEAVAKTDVAWTELNVPVKVELQAPASFSASGRLYMRRDKDIYISMRVLGIEVATAYVDKDSVYLADKFNRRYVAEPISSLMNSAALSVGDIQDMILGRVFIVGEGELTTKNAKSKTVKLSEQADSWTVSTKGNSPAQFNFDLSKQGNVLQSLTVAYGEKSATCRYSQPVTTDFGRFMSVASIDTSLKDKRISATLRLSLSGVKFQVDQSVGWRNPSGYTRIPAESILKALKGF